MKFSSNNKGLIDFGYQNQSSFDAKSHSNIMNNAGESQQVIARNEDSFTSK
jgi:hypothetical protein